MNKKIKIIFLSLIAALLVGATYSVQKFNRDKNNINDLTAKVEKLESSLSEAEEKIEQLEDQLKGVQHFDDDGTVGTGYLSEAVNFTGQFLEAQIDGDFEGWDGETIFKMTDGTIWQQASYDYTYHYSYMPKVIIYKKSGSYYMKVEDVDDEIEVKRIK